ncbi:Hypothetical protein CAP_6000 [Chondromyces apiculatus DSM 436]|uniref:Uncharacterized protein n=1 Tax=Chondromyces apiculatus DSM 436 TaxID=1192034 RepID=A0A017TG69_9BACT|nr:Hypothetical protein CAP_6000 [Chondromyces apiculatus DSM 436]
MTANLIHVTANLIHVAANLIHVAANLILVAANPAHPTMCADPRRQSYLHVTAKRIRVPVVRVL